MILQANNFGNNDYKHLLNQFESINGNLNHQPNMNDSNEASNHNYWQTFLFLDEKQPIVNESFLHVLESKFNLKLMRFNIEKQDQYQSKFHTMFKEILPTYRGSPPPFPAEPTLMNILVFLRNWKKTFHKQETKMSFHLPSGKTIPIVQMKAMVNGELGYSKSLKSLFVTIPYLDEQYRMVLVMPTGGQTIPNLLKTTKPNDLYSFIRRLITDQSMKNLYDLYMPPFKIEQDLELTQFLSRLFPKESFNMDQITPAMNNLRSKQMSIIEVSEEGTFAQAITLFSSRMLIMPNTNVMIDSPFLYFITYNDETTNDNKFEILFAGYVNNPTI